MTLEDLEGLCTGNNFTPEPLARIEKTAFKQEDLKDIRLDNLDALGDSAPLWVKSCIPSWLEDTFQSLWGESMGQELKALNQPAPMDLRVNTLKRDRDWVLEKLQKDRIEASATLLSPNGIRMARRTPMSTHEYYKEGIIEIQDESSQIASLLVEAEPNMTVLDLCAGAGGKTLALAATMKNKGKIYACDVIDWRLKRSKERLRRAGAHNVECRLLENLKDSWLKRQTSRFNRVLVDAPCTGSGTWRRNPDQKWRLKPIDLEELVVEQASILEAAAPLVKIEGRLIYSTCSLLPQENEHQIEKFLAKNPEFKVLPVHYLWDDYVKEHQISKDSPYLRLTPHAHGTDGFFVAILIKYKDREYI
jgi:16S rRNA (cytosine967-C5)-methyltransferase